MPVNYTGLFNLIDPVEIICPADGDARNAESVNTPLQALADQVQTTRSFHRRMAACNMEEVNDAMLPSGSSARGICVGQGGLMAVMVGGLADNSACGIAWNTYEPRSGWVEASSYPAGAPLLAVAHNGNIFVAVGMVDGGNKGRILQSDSAGDVWTARTNPASAGASKHLRAIAWSDDLSLFVAMGAGVLITSPDGTTWTDRTAIGGTPTAVAWSAEAQRFVAASAGSGVYYSEDGITWTAAATAITNPRHVACGVVGGFEHLVCVSASSGTPALDGSVWISEDGDTWDEQISGIECATNAGVAIGGDVAVCFTRLPFSYVSMDGFTWEKRPLGAGLALANTPNMQAFWGGNVNRFLATKDVDDIYVSLSSG